MSAALFNSIKGLFYQPQLEWREIQKNYQGSILYTLRYYFLIFFLLIPLAFSLRLIFDTFNFKFIFFRGWLISWILLGGYVFILYLLSIVIEEAGEFIAGINASGIGSKVAFFSALPFLSLTILAPVPKIGFLFLVIGFLYQVYLIFIGGGQLLNLQGSKRILWFIAVLISFMLLLFLILLLAALMTLLFQLI